MQKIEKLEYGQFYHIYNHAVGGRDLFRIPDNYEYFLGLYDKYISSVADTYAWVLMKNHFHILVRINDFIDITPDRVQNPVWGNNKIGTPSQQFSKLFNSYAQAYNKYYETRGALFERPFKRKLIDNKYYLKQVILYIHNNPVHHGFCEYPDEYPWSSYLTCVSIKPTKLQREKVVGWFDGNASFKTTHNEKFNMNEMDDWLGM
ncbi:MAG: hypothetical protein PHH37_14030 [Paludibacter sp.]|nr:hypothetical protein [Paludibacter sp.]